MLDELRPLRVFVDSVEIAEEKRVRVQGRSSMTLFPDFFAVDFYNLSDEDLGAIKNGKKLKASGVDNSTICYGSIEDIYQHHADSNDITTVGVSDGSAFWEAKVNKSIGRGAGLKETIASVLEGAVFGTYLAENPRLLRGQAIYGSLANFVQKSASGVNARAFIVHDTLHIVEKKKSENIVTIPEDAIIEEPEFAKGVCIVKLTVKGFSVGTMAYMRNRLYRIVAQAVDADNFSGNWNTEVVLADENMVDMMGGW